MPRKKAPEWISIDEAAQIVTANSGHTVGTDYLRKLASLGKLDTRPYDKRTNQYRRDQIEALKVKQYAERKKKGGAEVEQTASESI